MATVSTLVSLSTSYPSTCSFVIPASLGKSSIADPVPDVANRTASSAVNGGLCGEVKYKAPMMSTNTRTGEASKISRTF
ncbi:hypothetical protein LJK87_08315 [Paenibacillus sp. P25]|nr:hypothetical protein LJK87_08315 [Paenibacillus sp. P25]